MKGPIAILGVALALGGIANLFQEDNIDLKESKQIFQHNDVYNVVSIKSPRLVGFPLQFFAKVLHLPFFGPFVLTILKKKNQFSIVQKLAAVLDHEMPLYYPVKPPSKTQLAKENGMADLFDLDTFINTQRQRGKGFQHWTISDYREKYMAKTLTPIQVAKALLQLIKKSNNRETLPLKAIIAFNEKEILQEAKQSTQRYKEGNHIGILDGVPILVKDEVDVKGYETTEGTSFVRNGVAKEDCPPVARLRAQGALIIGKGNLHEIGLGTTGHNPFFGSARNPYNLNHYTGGSSSGPSAAVAAGLVPLAVGTDGGGSIRIPASLCGVVGFKPTFKRIAMDFEMAPSVGHMGPIAGTVQDCAIGYAIMAGARKGDAQSENQPNVHVASFDDVNDLSDVRIGIFSKHIEDAHESVVKATKKAIEYYKSKGAKVVDITIPHMRETNMAHAITILTEMTQSREKYYDQIHKFSLETQISMEIGRSINSREFLAAQRIRAYALNEMEKIFQKVDVILSPGTAMTAPVMRPDAELLGESNLVQTTNLMKYIIHGNFIGIPAMVFPVDYDSNGLPIAIQLQGRHWEESLLLRLAHSGQGILQNGWKRPKYYVSVIDEAEKIN